jgi:hypothetical protein
VRQRKGCHLCSIKFHRSPKCAVCVYVNLCACIDVCACVSESVCQYLTCDGA